MLKRKVFLAAAFIAAAMSVKAQNYTLEGNINNSAYDGLHMYLLRVAVTNSRETSVVDSALIKDGRFRFNLSVTSPYIGRITLPEKDSVHHFLYDLPEATAIVEPDAKISLEYNAGDPYATTITGGKINADYDRTILAANRNNRKESAVLMKKREEEEKVKPYTDAQNDAFSAKLRNIYASEKPAEIAFIKQNIGNDAGATEFFYHDSAWYGKALYDSLSQMVKPEYLVSYSERVKKENEAVEREQYIRSHTHPGVQYTDFATKTVDGKDVKLSDFMKPGHIVMIDFWASWCVPCQMEIPHLKDLYKKWHDKGLDIISVSLDTKRQPWLKAMERNKMPWTQVSTLEGFNAEAAKAYAVAAIPFVVIIDQQGKLALVNLHGELMDKKIEELLSKNK